MTEIQDLAQKLGITDSQLAKLRVKHKTDKALRTWLRGRWDEYRDRKRFLSRSSVPPYTSMEDELDAGESPPPDEIETYRVTREARLRYQDERMEEVGGLMAAMREVRAALDALPEQTRQKHSRAIWAYKGRMDALERDIRRQVAA